MVNKDIYGYQARITTSFIEIPSVISTAIYLTGCSFNCPECQNKELQNILYGKKTSVQEILNIINENTLAKWVCFLGGEPFYQSEFLFELCKKIEKPIGIYTGNEFGIVNDKYKNIIDLPNIKFLKTGRYDLNLIKQNEFPITSNQNVYLKINNQWKICPERTIENITKYIQSL